MDFVPQVKLRNAGGWWCHAASQTAVQSEAILQVSQSQIPLYRMWMQTACRDLTNYQWRLVCNAVGQCSLPIFVKLVFAEICRWRSYTKPQDTYLASTVMDSIMLLFERVEKQVSTSTFRRCTDSSEAHSTS